MAVDITTIASTGRRQDIFVIGPDGMLYHAYDDGKAWHTWENLGGKLTSAPAASWNADMTRVDVYARGGDLALWHLVWTAAKGWGTWEGMGGGLASGPAVADLGPPGPRGPKGDTGPTGTMPLSFDATLTVK